MTDTDTLAAALIRLQSKLPRITKTADGQFGKYANLASLHDAVLPLLGECDLVWYCYPTIRDDGQFVLAYRLVHLKGGHIEGHYPLPNGTAQAIGSAITYARRYALTAVLGIAPVEDDDDGKAASADPAPQWRPPVNPRTRKAQRTRGPLPDDEFNTADADEPGSITDAQRAKLMAMFNRSGRLERTQRLAYAMSALDLPELASSNDLSMRQAGELIAKLESEVQQ